LIDDYFEHAPTGMLLSSPEGRVRAANDASSRVTGFTAIELLGRDDAFQRWRLVLTALLM